MGKTSKPEETQLGSPAVEPVVEPVVESKGKTLSLKGNKSVTSNLPIIPDVQVNGGVNAVYLFEVETYSKEVDEYDKDGKRNTSIYAGHTRPTLAFRFKSMGNEKGIKRDNIHITRFFGIDNSKQDGTAIEVESQVKGIIGIFDHILHIYGSCEGPLAVNRRPFADIDVDEEALTSDDAETRIAAFEGFFQAVVERFQGTGTEKPVYIGAAKNDYDQHVPLYLILTARKDGSFDIPQYVRKGYIEPIRYKGTTPQPPQIYIDPRYDSIVVKPKEQTKATPGDVAAQVSKDLGLNLD